MIAIFGSVACCRAATNIRPDKLVSLSNGELVRLGQGYWDKNNMDSALICFSVISNRGSGKLSRDDVRLVCSATAAMGNIWANRFYDYERAMQCMLKAQSIAQDNNFKEQVADICENMAVLEDSKNDIQNDFRFNPASFKLHRQAFELSAPSRRPQHIIVLSMINMTTAALGHNKLELIARNLKSFSQMEISDTIPARKFAKLQCRAAMYALKGDYDNAIKVLSQLETSIDMIDHVKPVYQAIAHENLFFAYRAKNDIRAALCQLDTMESIATRYGIKNALIEVLLHKRECYAAFGNKRLADDYDLKYHKEKDKFMTDAKVAKADEEKVIFKLDEANNEIKTLSYQRKIQQTKLWAVVVIALLMLALLLIVWRSRKRTRMNNRLLYEQNRQLLDNIDRMRQLRQKQAGEASDAQPEQEQAKKYSRSKMEEEEISRVIDKVERVMDTSSEIFSTDFSLDSLAVLTGESRSRLSQAINEAQGRNFYAMLNEYRVREACRRLNDKERYGSYTIEAIAQSVGFKSRSNFVTTFKRITGLTPSSYIKHSTENSNTDTALGTS